MRKLMMTMMVLLLAVTVATAQSGQGHRDDSLPAALNLSAEQQARIKAIKEEGRARMQALRQQRPEQRPDREALMKIRANAREQVQAVLTPEQRIKLEELKAERKAARQAVDKQALKAAMNAHTESKVKPVIAAARARFNQEISAGDQATLERLRPVFADKPGRKGMRDDKGHQKGKKPSEEQRAAFRAETESWKTDHAAEISELKALTSKYAAALKSLRERMAPQRQQWAKEKREIAARYLPEGARDAKGKKEKAHQKKGMGESGHSDHRQPEGKKDQTDDGGAWPRAAAFLLMKG